MDGGEILSVGPGRYLHGHRGPLLSRLDSNADILRRAPAASAVREVDAERDRLVQAPSRLEGQCGRIPVQVRGQSEVRVDESRKRDGRRRRIPRYAGYHKLGPTGHVAALVPVELVVHPWLGLRDHLHDQPIVLIRRAEPFLDRGRRERNLDPALSASIRPSHSAHGLRVEVLALTHARRGPDVGSGPGVPGRVARVPRSPYWVDSDVRSPGVAAGGHIDAQLRGLHDEPVRMALVQVAPPQERLARVCGADANRRHLRQVLVRLEVADERRGAGLVPVLSLHEDEGRGRTDATAKPDDGNGKSGSMNSHEVVPVAGLPRDCADGRSSRAAHTLLHS